MSIFKKKRPSSNKQPSEIVHNTIGEAVHIFRDDNGIATPIKKINGAYTLPTGEEWCPDCHRLMIHKDGYWECEICNHSITDEEAEYGDGYPTLESTYQDDYGEYWNPIKDDMPECCEACGGPWPDCEASCKLFDD